MPPSHEVFISSEGISGSQAHVVDSGGRELSNVRSATIYLAANEITSVSLEIAVPYVAVKAHVEEIVFACPVCTASMTHHCHGDTLGGT